MTATPITARPRIVTARALVLGTALAVGLTGCGGGDDEPSSQETPMGALDKMFEEAWADWDEEASNAKQMQVEELQAECMREQGFEYIPVDWAAMNGGAVAVAPAEDDIPWGTLEFAEQWGYGITTNPYEDSEEPVEPTPIDEGYEDPNMEIVNAMSETEQQAYYEALYGPQSDEPIDPEGEWVPPSWEEMGCSGYAQHEVYGESAFGGGEDPFAELMDEMNRMWESISTDDRILATESEWSSCMADAGHPNLAKVGDAEQIIYDQVDPIWNDAYTDMPPDATEEDYRAVEEQVQEQLAAITPEEIELAVDDFTCRKDVGYDDAYTEVNLDLQQQFYDAHKAELEEWVAYQQEQNA